MRAGTRNRRAGLARRAASLATVAVLAGASTTCGHATRRDLSAGRLVREPAPTTTSTTEPPTTEPPTTEPPTTAPPPPPTAAPAPPPTVKAAAAKPARPVAVPSVPAPAGSVAIFAGLGTWVDVYDWSHYKNSTPTVGPDQVDQMADEGVQTLFIQTTKHDAPDAIIEPDLLLPILQRAHERGLQVVGWYLPSLDDVDNDFNRLMATAALPVDTIAVDIESRNVSDVQERNRRLVDLSSRLRQALPGRAIGAIVLPPVVLEVVNPNYWPGFPWQDIAPYYDVWQVMSYWTNRTSASGYRDPYRYTSENLTRLRNDLGNPSAPISPIGGLAERTSPDDVAAFLRACVEAGAMGGSLYDWRTTGDGLWPPLQGFRTP
jgi:hypothetical protein